MSADKETIETLLALLNPIHGALDKQTYDAYLAAELDLPPDAEHDVVITTKMERDLTQAVCILENRLKAAEELARRTKA
jgi:hypothetical protein